MTDMNLEWLISFWFSSFATVPDLVDLIKTVKTDTVSMPSGWCKIK